MSLTSLKGVGPKTLALLNKLNINNENDLINYYPYRYEVIKRSNLNELNDIDNIIIDGVVESKPTIYYFGKLKKISFRICTKNQIFNVSVYNQVYLMKELNLGTTITIIGKYNKTKNAIIANKIKLEPLPDVPVIESIYHTVNGINIKTISKIIKSLLETTHNYPDFIPSYLTQKYDFIDKETALKEIHKPTSLSLLKKARLRLKYEELFRYMLKITYLKNKIKYDDKAIKRDIDYEKVNSFINNLSYELTIDQKKAIKEILDDMSSNKRMNRLLQGDVGSGKTIVSFVASYANYLSGYQCALMVPTEILAKQHYENATKIFKDTGMTIDILTSSTKAKEKKEIYNRLNTGITNLVIGTQSLIQETITYHNLGLVITDEQHRFGVAQRNNLKNKGIMPDMLSMSATPIPRTYALTIYGDLDVTNIKTKPVGRKEIITKVFLEENILGVLEGMNKELLSKHQIYVIAPSIEENINDTESVASLDIKMNKAFGHKYKIGVVHGKLDSLEKEKVMEDFEKGKINILISTTVIEVGLDIKNASMIVIFDANMFGLSTLHQLRGRVGRSDIQSYCYLVSKSFDKRLNMLEHTNDGFEIAEYDFNNRGEGELFGIRQSGTNSFLLADIRKDFKILLHAKDDAVEFLNNNKQEEYPNIYNELINTNNLE